MSHKISVLLYFFQSKTVGPFGVIFFWGRFQFAPPQLRLNKYLSIFLPSFLSSLFVVLLRLIISLERFLATVYNNPNGTSLLLKKRGAWWVKILFFLFSYFVFLFSYLSIFTQFAWLYLEIYVNAFNMWLVKKAIFYKQNVTKMWYEM